MIKLKLIRFDPLTFLRNNWKDKWTRTISWRRLLYGWMKGFTSEHILLFDLRPENENWRGFIPDLHRYRVTLQTNKHVWLILHDKLVFDAYMAGRLPIIRALCSITEGQFSGWTEEEFLKRVSSGERLVVKAAQGGTGVGLLFIQTVNGQIMVNGRQHSLEDLRALVRTLPHHVCYPYLNAHPALRAVYPDAANALRVTLFRNLEGRPQLLAPVFCVGTAASAPVEHFCNGGLIVQIDEDTGRCTKAQRLAADGTRQLITHHPDTQAPLIGLEIPFWQEIKSTLLDFHERHPAFDLVGWDVLVAEDQFWIIEGNHNPGLRIPLMNRHLGEEPEFRAFLEQRGILETRSHRQTPAGNASTPS